MGILHGDIIMGSDKQGAEYFGHPYLEIRLEILPTGESWRCHHDWQRKLPICQYIPIGVL